MNFEQNSKIDQKETIHQDNDTTTIWAFTYDKNRKVISIDYKLLANQTKEAGIDMIKEAWNDLRWKVTQWKENILSIMKNPRQLKNILTNVINKTADIGKNIAKAWYQWVPKIINDSLNGLHWVSKKVADRIYSRNVAVFEALMKDWSTLKNKIKGNSSSLFKTLVKK